MTLPRPFANRLQQRQGDFLSFHSFAPSSPGRRSPHLVHEERKRTEFSSIFVDKLWGSSSSSVLSSLPALHQAHQPQLLPVLPSLALVLLLGLVLASGSSSGSSASAAAGFAITGFGASARSCPRFWLFIRLISLSCCRFCHHWLWCFCLFRWPWESTFWLGCMPGARHH